MISLAPNSITAEKMVIDFARSHKVRLGIVFFNVLLKKLITRHQKEEENIEALVSIKNIYKFFFY